MDNYFPILDTIRNYRKSYLKKDMIAGLVVGVMLIPQGMAYAMIAGLPPVYGLYAAIFPQVIYALFGTSRQLAVGPVAMDSLLMITALSVFEPAGTADYIQLVVLLTLMVGLVQMVMGILKLGFLTNFLSRPVILGFTMAAALVIAVNQLKYVFGLELSGANSVYDVIFGLLTQADQVSVYSVTLGTTALVTFFLSKWKIPQFPMGLVWLFLGSVVVYFLNLDEKGVKTLGFIPKGLPSFEALSWDLKLITELLPIAFTLAFVGFAEAFSIAKSVEYNRGGKEELKANQELFALGLGNALGAFMSSFPTTGSFSRTALNVNLGAKTSVASLISAVLVLSTLLFFTELFYYLPETLLAAMIIVAVLGLIKPAEIQSLWKADRSDFLMFLISFLMTIVFGIEWGILLGIVLSLGVVIYKTSKPHMAELGQVEGTKSFRNVERFSNAKIRSDVTILRFDSRLYFANVSALRNRVNGLINHREGLKTFILDAQSINDIDSTGILVLKSILGDLRNMGIAFKFVSVIGPVRDKLYLSGITELVGIENFHGSIESALGIVEETTVPFQTNA